jgi:predicted enzyme related to lactoylglutathione lyase
MNHTVCHVEWQVTNLEMAQEFYGGMFGWSFEPMGESYVLFRTGDDVGGGLELADSVASGSSPLVYILTGDIEESLAKAEVYGGEVVKRTTEIPGHGVYAIVADPDGNRVGLFSGR